MYNDKELIIEILQQINNALEVVLYRFAPVRKVLDFTNSLGEWRNWIQYVCNL